MPIPACLTTACPSKSSSMAPIPYTTTPGSACPYSTRWPMYANTWVIAGLLLLLVWP
jgi:hypothetical protein